MKKTRLKIAHILPGMYFGGVEVAILKSFEQLNIDFDYEVFFVKGRGKLDSNQQHVLKLIYRIIRNKNDYDLIVTSLWWGHLIGILLSLFGMKWTCFIHSMGSSSIMDKLVTKIALSKCPNHLFDSESTKNFYKNFKNKKSFVIPYIFEEKEKDVILKKDAKYDFSWIGRNSEEKRLDLLAKFIRSLKERSFNFECIISIAGKPYPIIDKLEKESNNNIKVVYDTDPNDIININHESKMILCFSNYEGFSVTTAEAALRGNLVAARNVGELSNYLCNQNTIWLESTDENKWSVFVDRVIETLKNDDELYKKRIKSQEFTQAYFLNKNYVESISSAFKSLIISTHD